MNSYSTSYSPAQYSPKPQYSPSAPQGGGALPQGFWASAGGAFTQTPQQNQSTAYQLNNLTSSNSPYMQQVSSQAAAQAAGRGMGNSAYAVGNAQGAAIRAAMPIAQADAAMYSATAQQNQAALNQTQLADRQNSTSMSNAATAAGASMYGSQMSYNASRYGQDQQTLRQGNQNEWQGGQNVLNNQYAQAYQQQGAQLANYNNAQSWQRDQYGRIMQSAVNTTLSDPANYNNPQAAMGMISGYTNYAGNMLNNFLNGSP